MVKKKISTILSYGFTATTNDDEFTVYIYVSRFLMSFLFKTSINSGLLLRGGIR